jgi:hypothetical protein
MPKKRKKGEVWLNCYRCQPPGGGNGPRRTQSCSALKRVGAISKPMEPQTLTMSGLEPANQPPRVGAANDLSLADARELDGRLKAGHGE